MENEQVVEKWNELKEVVASAELDVHKHALKGNAAAGVRVRKTLRAVKARASELVKLTLSSNKTE